jgi:secreted Zn-dependent insulinase-like peptidase
LVALAFYHLLYITGLVYFMLFLWAFFGMQNLQIIVKAVPVREGHNLEMMFPITPEIQNYTAAPSRYLGHLIGHEADGSLFALLKKLGENIYK